MEALTMGIGAQRLGRGARDERQEGQREAVAGLKLRLVALAHAWPPWSCRLLCTVVTCAEVRLLITMCSAIFVRMMLMGSTRPCRWRRGWRPPEPRPRRVRAAWPERAAGATGPRLPDRRGRRQVGFHVLLGDAPAGAGALHLLQVDVVSRAMLPHQRRKRTARAGSARSGSGGRRPRARAAGCGARAGVAAEPERRGRGAAAAAGRRRRDRAVAAFVDARHHGVDRRPSCLPPPASRPARRPQARGSRCPPCRSRFRTAVVPLHALPAFFSHLVSVPSTMLSPIWGITTSIMQLLLSCTGSTMSSSNTRAKQRRDARHDLPRGSARTPSSAIEVTGLVSPQGTMY